MSVSFVDRMWPGFGRDLFLNRIAASTLVPRPLRWRLLRAFGLDIEHSSISPRVWFGNRKVAIGAGSFINYECVFNSTAHIRLGRNCFVAMGVSFVTSSHEVGPASMRAGAPLAAPITVGDGVWIGANATILPGVTIGSGVVIAAGAVVVSDCADDGVYAGVPARRIKELAGELEVSARQL